MALFDRLFSKEKPDGALVAETIEAVVTAVEPKLRADNSYKRKLDGCTRHAIEYLRSIGRGHLEPVPLSRAAWADDPRVNAFFATADDVPACLGRSHELRRFFDQPANAGVQEAYALLGMKKEERKVLGMDLKGDSVQRDVAQTQVSFTGHRIVDPTSTLAATRLDIGRRIILRLAQVALARIVEADSKATELEQHKAYLGARLRLLRLAKDGMEGIVKDPATIAAEMKEVEAKLKTTVDDYIEAKASIATLDGYVGHIRDVLSHPEQHIALSQTPLRVSRLGVRVEGEASGPVNELSLAELTIGPDWRAAIAIVRCARAEVPSKEELIAQAERTL